MSEKDTEVRACRNCMASVEPEDDYCYRCRKPRDWTPLNVKREGSKKKVQIRKIKN